MSDLVGNHIVGFPTRRLRVLKLLPRTLMTFSNRNNELANYVLDRAIRSR